MTKTIKKKTTKKKVTKKKSTLKDDVTTAKNKGGRPTIEIPFQRLEDFATYGASKKSVAWHLGVSEDTIENRVREKYDKTYTELKEELMEGVKISLIQVALEQAKSGKAHAVMIFCLKNLAKWTDKQEHELGPNTRRAFGFTFDKEAPKL